MRHLLLPLALLVFAAGCENQAPAKPERSPSRSAADSVDGMCVEHGVPEALCTKCNPGLAQVFKAKGDWCAEHEFPESFCPVCNPDAEFPELGADTAAESTPGAATTERPADSQASDGQIEGRVVRFDSPEIEARAGIETVKAKKAEGAATVECSAELSFNANEVADIRAIVPGVVREVRVQLGQSVEKGEPLFVLESTKIGDIQASLQTAAERVRVAETNLARQRELHNDQIASARQVEMAENELASARASAQAAKSALRMAGAGKGSTSGRYTLRAPIDGDIVRRPGVVGVFATADQSLATVAETSTLWAMCAIPEREATRVQPGHSLRLELLDGEVAVGEITWVSPEVDPRTRMVNARAEVPNPDGKLRANQFLDATVVAGAPKSSVVVPYEAVQRVEGREVVFVRARAGTYLPRVVSRYGDGKLVAVEGKLEPGDEVVTKGAVLLRTEVLPNSIGAGCCEVEPPGSDD